MFVLKDIDLKFGGRVLLDQVNWQMGERDRVALIGGNGVGKSTLMKIIAGIQESDHGDVLAPKNATFGYLPQDGLHFEGQTLFEEARSVFDEILSMESELRSLEKKLGELDESEPSYTEALERYDMLLNRFQQWDGYRIDAEVGRVLEGLGFSRDDWSKSCETFSGGWQMRIALAKLLLEQPSMLLLDEPTNHLDLEARDWLRTYMADYPAAMLLVSHDRFFLDAVVNRCVELFGGKLTQYNGNFSFFEVERERRYEALEEAARRQQEEIDKIEKFIERFRYKATKATQVQSRVKQLEKIERIVLPPKPPKVRFHFPEPPRSGRVVLELKDIKKSYDDNHVLTGASMVLERQEKVALVGVNGAGKSTLMRIIADQSEFGGERIIGYQVEAGFFAQDQRAVLDPSMTILQSLEEIAPIDMVPKLRSLLGAFLFTGDDVYKKISVLSGGERSRVALARLLMQPYNLLLLDEPTNHLDVHAQEILLNALKEFPGTILFVSHDRYFIDQLATGIVEVKDGVVERFIGNYADYIRTKAARGDVAGVGDGVQYTTQNKGDDEVQVVPTSGKSATLKPIDDTRQDRQSQYQERQQEKRAFTKKEKLLRKEVESLEGKLEEKEERIAELEEQMAAPGFYDDFEQASQVTADYEALKQEVEEGYEKWETLSTELTEWVEAHAHLQE